MKWLSGLSFYRRNQLSLIVFILLPLALATTLSYMLINNVMLEKVQSSRQNSINIMANDMNRSIEDIIYATNLFSYRQSAAYLDLFAFKDVSRIDDSEQYMRYNRISEILDLAFSKTSGLKTSVFYVNKGNISLNNPGVKVDELIQFMDSQFDEAWKKQADPARIYKLNGANPVREGLSALLPAQSFYYFIKVIKPYDKSDYYGVLYVGLPVQYFQTLFAGMETGQLSLYDSDGSLIQRHSEQAEVLPDGHSIELQAAVPRMGWHLVYTFSSDEVMKEIRSIVLFYALMLSLSILVFMTVSIMLAKKLHRPLFLLKKTAEQFGGGNRLVRFPVKGKDELAVLGNAFNTMLDQINRLIHDVEQEQEDRRILELQALYSQIRPHFLMNTLNSIRCGLLLSGDEPHSRQLEALMSLLRAYMRINEGSPLHHECKLLQDYADIMKIRSGLDFRLTIDLPQAYESIEVPKLVLQPLVENAIVHGFIESPADAQISISVTGEEDHLLIRIHDNGVGADDERLSEIRTMISSEVAGESANSLGIVNTLKRLKLTFGEPVSMAVRRNQGTGLTFELSLPLPLGWRSKEDRDDVQSDAH